jgi:glycosyltransferase involved in cell wall biosynthesis
LGVQNQLLSIVLPVYNEAPGLSNLFERLQATLSKLPFEYEIVAVNDGSRDNSEAVLVALAQKDSHIRVIKFKRNFGQTAALAAGIEHARGQVIATIDSDLENDPADIPRLLAKLDEGYDVVSGWRQKRWQGAYLTRQLPSHVANWLISKLTGVHLHDYGCTLKVYRADLIKGVNLYGEMHRFVAAYAAWQGGRVAELPVTHHPRSHGKSNYGFSRTFRVLLDLVVIVFMHRYFNRPMHFFGGWGFVSFAIGAALGFAAIVLRILSLPHFIESLPILSTLFILVGIQLVLFGVMAEILMRTYYESQGKRPWVIKGENPDIV